VGRDDEAPGRRLCCKRMGSTAAEAGVGEAGEGIAAARIVHRLGRGSYCRDTYCPCARAIPPYPDVGVAFSSGHYELACRRESATDEAFHPCRLSFAAGGAGRGAWGRSSGRAFDSSDGRNNCRREIIFYRRRSRPSKAALAGLFLSLMVFLINGPDSLSCASATLS
jgi:hypothetical protein